MLGENQSCVNRNAHRRSIIFLGTTVGPYAAHPIARRSLHDEWLFCVVFDNGQSRSVEDHPSLVRGPWYNKPVEGARPGYNSLIILIIKKLVIVISAGYVSFVMPLIS